MLVFAAITALAPRANAQTNVDVNGVLKDADKTKCSRADRDYADFWEKYYDPEQARKFGVQIQNLVRERDLLGLFRLVNGELSYGPRKSFVADRSFEEIFDKNWRSSILSSDPPCSPVGWRGFTLANGLIWFDKGRQTDWSIFSINGASRESYAPALLDPVWRIGNEVILPQCLVKMWISSDNFEAFEDKFGIKDTADFRLYPGRYIGKEVSSIESIDPPWGSGEKLFLVSLVKECSSSMAFLAINSKNSVSSDANGVSTKQYDVSGSYVVEEAYRLLAPISQEDCQGLAPHFSGRCETAHLVARGDYSGGSMGWDYSYNIYGLFTLEDGREAIVPLVNFDKENDARNFIDRLSTK